MFKKALVLDAHESENGIVSMVKTVLELSFQTIWFRLNRMNISPCASCDSCGHKTPGICAIDDDMKTVMRAIATNDVLVFFTPVRYGGYPSLLKKAVDRLMPMGLPLYKVEKGHLVHPMRYPNKTLIGIGITEMEDKEQEENFRALVSQNGMNFQAKRHVFIFNSSMNINAVRENLTNLLAEAGGE